MVGGTGGGAGEVAIVRVVIGLGVRAFITGEILDAAILGDAIDGEAAVVFIVGAGPEERGSGPMGETGRSGLAKAGPIVQTITERADGATPAFDEGSEDFIGIAEDLEGGVVWQDQVEAHPPIRQAGDGFDLGAHQRTRVVFGVGMDDLRLEGGGEVGGLGFHNSARGAGGGDGGCGAIPGGGKEGRGIAAEAGLSVGGVIHHALEPGFAGAVGAAKDFALPLDAVADDAAFAVIADRGEDVDSAFEGVEAVSFARDDEIKTFVIFVSAVVAGFHNGSEGWVG